MAPSRHFLDAEPAMPSSPQTLLQYARWCRITAQNGAPDNREANLRWAEKLEHMAATCEAESSVAAGGDHPTGMATAEILPWKQR